jgi:hypothetical protein
VALAPLGHMVLHAAATRAREAAQRLLQRASSLGVSFRNEVHEWCAAAHSDLLLLLPALRAAVERLPPWARGASDLSVFLEVEASKVDPLLRRACDDGAAGPQASRAEGGAGLSVRLDGDTLEAVTNALLELQSIAARLQVGIKCPILHAK